MFSYSAMVAERAAAIGEARGRALERAKIMESVKAAKRMHKDGVSLKEIAAKCGLSEDELEEILS